MDDLRKNPACHSVYYRLIIPKDIQLHNVIFSEEQEEIMIKETGIKYEIAENVNNRAMFVNWTIAKVGIGHKIAHEKKSDPMAAFED